MKNLFTRVTAILAGFCGASVAQAGIFSIPQFVEPGTSALGIEPELTTSSGTGLAANLRFQYGMNDLSNLHAIVGGGGEPRKFRIGSAYTFDFYPDVARQPGIGIALSGIYYRYPTFGQLDVTASPYIHKAFYNGPQSVEPFLAIPTGPEVRSDDLDWATSVVFGAMFHTEGSRVSFIGEVGVNVHHAETYLSGGVLFRQ